MAEQTHALARLITEYKERTGESLAVIAQRSGLPKATVGAYVNSPVLSVPKPENLAKLALGLQADIATVTRAAQEAAGYYVGETTTSDGTQLFISHYQQLTEAEQRSVAALVEHYLQERRKEDRSNIRSNHKS